MKIVNAEEDSLPANIEWKAETFCSLLFGPPQSQNMPHVYL